MPLPASHQSGQIPLSRTVIKLYFLPCGLSPLHFVLQESSQVQPPFFMTEHRSPSPRRSLPHERSSTPLPASHQSGQIPLSRTVIKLYFLPCGLSPLHFVLQESSQVQPPFFMTEQASPSPRRSLPHEGSSTPVFAAWMFSLEVRSMASEPQRFVHCL